MQSFLRQPQDVSIKLILNLVTFLPLCIKCLGERRGKGGEVRFSQSDNFWWLDCFNKSTYRKKEIWSDGFDNEFRIFINCFSHWYGVFWIRAPNQSVILERILIVPAQIFYKTLAMLNLNLFSANITLFEYPRKRAYYSDYLLISRQK